MTGTSTCGARVWCRSPLPPPRNGGWQALPKRLPFSGARGWWPSRAACVCELKCVSAAHRPSSDGGCVARSYATGNRVRVSSGFSCTLNSVNGIQGCPWTWKSPRTGFLPLTVLSLCLQRLLPHTRSFPCCDAVLVPPASIHLRPDPHGARPLAGLGWYFLKGWGLKRAFDGGGD